MNDYQDDRPRGFLQDEQGSWSTARVLLVVELVYLWVLALLATFLPGTEVPGEVWALHGSLVIALIAWAGGPRAMQYLGPQVAGVAQGIAGAVRERLRGTDRFQKDDERG